MTTGNDATGGAHPWRPGDHILWRYRANGSRGSSDFHICRPVTVVQDTPDLLAVWMAPGTECIKPELADGTPVHAEPLATRYTKPRITVRSRWFGAGVLKLASPGRPWSVWLFWDRGWRFKNWYVNLEEPRRRWPGGVDSEDHFLDIAVYPDRSWEWRDEDEFAQAQQAGLLDAGQAERIRAAGREATRLIRAWDRPFSENWASWRPDPRWRTPQLPDDWDRSATAMAPVREEHRLPHHPRAS
ncbi:cytidylyl-2-hydroxypropylphosphonate hydrolase [Streptomyces sp. URMC 129]|uniref:cytidylyl-2-hydroxypropylphosphonate hydrolase n=1 Tax=Streptomyces sp. URMC 129 TaxID=3423407 RepID=UPI003F1E3ED0